MINRLLVSYAKQVSGASVILHAASYVKVSVEVTVFVDEFLVVLSTTLLSSS